LANFDTQAISDRKKSRRGGPGILNTQAVREKTKKGKGQAKEGGKTM